MLRSIATLAATAVCVAGTANSSPPEPGWEHVPARPMTYRDPRTSITLYVESDGRHVAAIDAHGTLLWVSDLSKKTRPCHAETETVVGRIRVGPQMIVFGKELQRFGFAARDQLIEIMFTSNYSGELDERTGDFVCMGLN